MKNKSMVLLLWMGCVSFAQATESLPLCPTPQLPNCVVSNWGQVGPDGTDEAAIAPPRGMGRQLARTMPKASRMVVEMQPVAALSDSSRRQPALKAVIDANPLFVPETAALTSAILRARFDRSGAIVRGAERIASAAAAAAEKAGNNYKLTLYIKQPSKQSDDARRMLTSRIQSLNAILTEAGRRGDGTRPKS